MCKIGYCYDPARHKKNIGEILPYNQKFHKYVRHNRRIKCQNEKILKYGIYRNGNEMVKSKSNVFRQRDPVGYFSCIHSYIGRGF